MTNNEGKARKLLDTAIKLGLDISYSISAMKSFDVPPPLTEDECRNIAINYPVSFRDVRSIFPWAGMIKSKKNFILLAYNDICQLVEAINDKINEGYIPVGRVWEDRKGEVGTKTYFQSMIIEYKEIP